MAMAMAMRFIATIIIVLLHLTPFSTAIDGAGEGAALIQFKQSLSNAPGLSSWLPNTSPCDPNATWTGVLCQNGFIAGLRLERLGLSGNLNLISLKQLHGLRAISLAGNSLSGPLPDSLSNLTTLRALYLQANNFSGTIPPTLFSKMTRLRKLYLAGNHFSGAIPISISQAKSLIILYLEGNQFSGSIPDISSLKALKSFNVSYNALEGSIPASAAKFGASAFAGNPGLCGDPLVNKPCDSPTLASAPAPSPDAQSLTMQTILAAAAVVSKEEGSDTITDTIGLIMLGIIFVLSFGVIIWGLALAHQGDEGDDYSTLNHKLNPTGSLAGDSSQAQSSLDRSIDIGGGGGGAKEVDGNTVELVMVNEEKGPITLTDLMKAAAEVLGSGGLGSAYKAVLPTGLPVAVKRMKDMNKAARQGFETEMRRLGRLNHPNVLPPLAYHYRKEEKLLVSEYMPKGSLLYVLHGNQGADHAALDWQTRMKIILGITRGVAYIHAELAPFMDVPHGNLKSGNVLLNNDFEPVIVDYGFISLVNPPQALLTMFAFKSPEALNGDHVSNKSDVYCLGIIILELITGKFPSQYLNNTKGGTDVVQWARSAVAEGHESDLLDPQIAIAPASITVMQQLVRVCLAFVEPDPDKRPDMEEALHLIEEIAATATDDYAGNQHENYVRSTSRSARRMNDDDNEDDDSES